MSPLRIAPPALIVLAGLTVLLAGCGKGKPEPKPGKDGKTDVPGKPSVDPGPGAGPAPTVPTLIPPMDLLQKKAEEFAKAIQDGAVNPATISTPFLKVIGKPVTFDADKPNGFSVSQASSWLLKAKGISSGVPTGYTADGVAVFSASLQPKENGRYLMRLVRDGDTWKLDWFQQCKVASPDLRLPQSADEMFQDFSIAGFEDLLSDRGATPPLDRAPLFAALLAPKLKNSWAEPFDGDKAKGYDFNPTKLAQKLTDLSKTQSAVTRNGGAVILTLTFPKDSTNKPIVLKLVKGVQPGEWLFEE